MSTRASVRYVVFFVTAYESLDEALAQAPDVVAAHLARSQQLHAAGTLLMAGAFVDTSTEPLSTLAILSTREAAEDFVRGDPFVQMGKVKEWSIREWADMFA